ncbi:hypothetical protein [Paenibacillus pinistramenti]|uniref:hypothetical protein n=1 Tax=Paenibacillus pinistramenti TaxID=1768003 RepID=UPI0013967EB2|nr:hypothetical protein [Paenibacillus pinistramenti]
MKKQEAGQAEKMPQQRHLLCFSMPVFPALCLPSALPAHSCNLLYLHLYRHPSQDRELINLPPLFSLPDLG